VPDGQDSDWIPGLDGEAIFEILAEHRVKYVLIGALGAAMQGFSRLTVDADLTPSTERANLRRLASALKAMHAKLRVPGLDHGVDFPLNENSFDLGNAYTFVTRYGPVDLVLRPDGTKGYEDLSREAVTFDVFGIKVQVASLSDIIRSKEAADRPKDREDVRLLRELQARTIDTKRTPGARTRDKLD